MHRTDLYWSQSGLSVTNQQENLSLFLMAYRTAAENSHLSLGDDSVNGIVHMGALLSSEPGPHREQELCLACMVEKYEDTRILSVYRYPKLLLKS
jgi:hypothetical protein